jgi:acetylornithine deacetylase
MAERLSDVELLRRLVAFDSTSARSNLPIADWIADYVAGPRVEVEHSRSADGRKTNLVVRCGPEPDDARAGLVLSGHMDVVPPGEDGWDADPFTLAERNGDLVGRGACDMKGFLALAMNRALDVVDRLRAPLVLLFTYDEELGCLGAQRFVTSGRSARALPRSVLIGEPTSLRAVRIHKGHVRVRLTVTGTSAHSAYPDRGVNAIEPAARAVSALADLRRQLEHERPAHGEHFPEAPFVALNVARIEGGTATNVVPDRCVIDVGIRTLPGTDTATVVERIRTTAIREAPGCEVRMLNETPPLLVEENAPLHRELRDLLDQRDACAVSFASDGGVLARIGLEPVLFGPGSIAVAHRPNEYVPRHELSRAGDVVAELVRRFCVDRTAA